MSNAAGRRHSPPFPVPLSKLFNEEEVFANLACLRITTVRLMRKHNI